MTRRRPGMRVAGGNFGWRAINRFIKAGVGGILLRRNIGLKQ